MSGPLLRQALRLQRARQVAQLRFSSRYSQPQPRAEQASAALQLPVDADARLSDFAPPSTSAPSNPYVKDKKTEYLEQREKALKRIRYASTGLFFSVLGLGITTYMLFDALEDEKYKRATQLDASDDANAKFQGREVHTIGVGADKRIVAEGFQEKIELVATGTSSVPYFPKVIFLPTKAAKAGGAQPNTAANPGNIRNDEEYTLIGLGIRTVSFLSIQVYVLGLYVRTTDLTGLQASLTRYINPQASTLVPSEKEELKKALLDPIRSTEIWELLLGDTNVKSAWRISPTRGTDFAHLRDGWITGINKGTQAARQRALAAAAGPAEAEYDSDAFGAAVKSFREMFASGGKAPKGSVVTLAMDERGGLDVLFEEAKRKGGKDGQGTEDDVVVKPAERLGGVADPRVGRLIWLGYLAGKNVSSEAARTGVADGCLTLAARPVGSAETMVT